MTENVFREVAGAKLSEKREEKDLHREEGQATFNKKERFKSTGRVTIEKGVTGRVHF